MPKGLEGKVNLAVVACEQSADRIKDMALDISATAYRSQCYPKRTKSELVEKIKSMGAEVNNMLTIAESIPVVEG